MYTITVTNILVGANTTGYTYTPLGARIIFVADAFDAMTSDRVYQPRLSTEDALAELERCAGSQFDPELVAALVEEVAARPSALIAS